MYSHDDFLEYVKEVYGMVYFLASALEVASGMPVDVSVKLAAQMHTAGYKYSPGLDGSNGRVITADENVEYCEATYLNREGGVCCMLIKGHESNHRTVNGVEWA
jgi:hypothetical protein